MSRLYARMHFMHLFWTCRNFCVRLMSIDLCLSGACMIIFDITTYTLMYTSTHKSAVGCFDHESMQRIHVRICIYSFVHMYRDFQQWIDEPIHIHAYIHTYTYTHIHTHIYIYIYIYSRDFRQWIDAAWSWRHDKTDGREGTVQLKYVIRMYVCIYACILVCIPMPWEDAWTTRFFVYVKCFVVLCSRWPPGATHTKSFRTNLFGIVKFSTVPNPKRLISNGGTFWSCRSTQVQSALSVLYVSHM